MQQLNNILIIHTLTFWKTGNLIGKIRNIVKNCTKINSPDKISNLTNVQSLNEIKQNISQPQFNFYLHHLREARPEFSYSA